MLKMNKKALLMAITVSLTCAIGSADVFAANADNQYMLDTVYVYGARNSQEDDTVPGGYLNQTVHTGILGQQRAVDTPFTQYSIPEKVISQYGNPATPAISALMNVPSVKGGATMTHNDFSIRGHYLQGASFYVNGIPGLYSQMNSPTNFIENIELLSGPNMLNGTQMESNAIAGTVNFISKKATDKPITTYTQTFQGRGNFAEYIDVGRRFGKDNSWGIRVNGELQNGEMSLKDSDLKTRGIFVNIDHQDEKSSSNLLLGYRHQEVERGMRWFKFGNKLTHVPSVPNAKNNYSFQQMDKEENSPILAFNHEQYLNDNVTWFTKIGMLNSDLKRNVSPQGSAYTIDNLNGDYSFTAYNGRTPNSYRYYQTGLNFKFDTGVVKNNLSVSFDDMTQKSYTNSTYKKNGKKYKGNLYHGTVPTVTDAFPTIDKYLSADSRLWGISLVENATYKKWNFVAGVHKHQSNVKSYALNGKMKNQVKSDAVSPVYGVMYKPNDNTSLYFSHTEGFSKGKLVSAGKLNENNILDPIKSKENEIGVKWETKKFLTTAAYFDIKEGKYIDLTNEKGETYTSTDGEVEFEGFEIYTTGKLTDKWNIFGGAMYVNAVRNKTDKGTYDGYRLDGSSRWNAVLGAEYAPNEDTSIFGRILFNGKTVVNQEKLELPSYTTFDLGITHNVKLGDYKAKLGLTCYNLFNRSYWMTRSGGNEVLLSMPRTFMLSAQFSF